MDENARVTGGNKRKIQLRRAPRQAFTAEKRQVFLDTLAGCANVTRAAAAAGVGVSTVYDARRRDPVFAEQWAEAIEAGYATLEALLIERAAVGGSYVPGDTPVPGPETVDTWLALDLLRLSRMAKAPRKGPGPAPRRAAEKQVAESICAKLAVLERRRKKGKAKESSPDKSAQGPGRRTPSPRPSPRRGEGDLPQSG